MRVRRLRRGHLTDGDWRRLLGNAFGVKVVDHWMVTVLHGYADGQQWERSTGCCGPHRRFGAAHGFRREEDWMDFALKKIEDGQVLGRRPDGTPFWEKDGVDLTRQNEQLGG